MRTLKPCGTSAAHQRHRLHGEEPCIECVDAYNQQQREYRAANPEVFARYDKKRPTHRHLQRTPEQRQDSKRRSRYGISNVQFDEIKEWHEGCCLCCGTTEPGTKGWHFEHDHKTDALRGLVCERCNRLLAQCGDDAASVARTALRLLAYLARSGDQLPEADIELLVEALRMRTDCEHLPNSENADPERAGRPRHRPGP